jgi:hypothetical protein
MLLVFLQGFFHISGSAVEPSYSRRGSEAREMVVLNSQARGTAFEETFREATLSAHRILAYVNENIHIILRQEIEKCL